MSFKNRMLKTAAALSIITIITAIAFPMFILKNIGDVLDDYNGIKVYYNGIDFVQNYGSHYSSDGFYYGKK